MNLELENDINRFIERQKEDYKTALKEIKKGKKQSCWMWFIFPQVRGLGSSTISSFYGIKDLDEGIQYLRNKKLRNNLIEITKALLDLGEVDIRDVMGFFDDIKLKSSMTFFNIVEKESGINCGGIFSKVLTQFFKGEEDENTYKILKKQKLKKENKNEINEEEKEKGKNEFKVDTIESEKTKIFIGKKTKESNVILENEENDNKDKGKEVKEKEEKEKEDKEKEYKVKEEIKEMENTKEEDKVKENKEEKEKVKKREKENVEKEDKEKENKEKEKENKEKEKEKKEDKTNEKKVEKENKNKEDKDKENKGKSLKNSENEKINVKIEDKGEGDNIEDQYETISYNEIKLPLKSPDKNYSLKNEKNGKDILSLHKNKNNINEQNKNEIKKDEEEIIMKNYDENKINGKNDINKNEDINKPTNVEKKNSKCCDINCNII